MHDERSPPGPGLDTPERAERYVREREDEPRHPEYTSPEGEPRDVSAGPGDGTLPRTEAIKNEVVRSVQTGT